MDFLDGVIVGILLCIICYVSIILAPILGDPETGVGWVERNKIKSNEDVIKTQQQTKWRII